MAIISPAKTKGDLKSSSPEKDASLISPHSHLAAEGKYAAGLTAS